MRPFIAVVQKELLERRLVFVAALIVGFLPLIPGWFVRFRGITPAEVRDYSALVVVALFTVGTALATGASLVSRELGENRLSFYYVRPIGGWRLWAGKLAAGLALLAASIVLVWLPSLVAGSRPWRLSFLYVDPVSFPRSVPWGVDLFPYLGDWGLFQKLTILEAVRHSAGLAVVLLLLLLVPLAHAAGVFARVRSAWLLFDLAMLLAVTGLLVGAAGRLTSQGAFYGTWHGARTIVFTLVFASLAAPGVQLALGRSRPPRSHAVFSLAFWTPLAAVALGLLVHAHLATRAEPEDLVEVLELKAAPRGDWAVVGGLASARAGYMPAFAVHLADGSSRLLDPLPFFDRAAVFSGDGRVLAWSRCVGTACEVRWLDLTRPADRPGVLEYVRRHLGDYFRTGEPIALSPGGRRLAMIQGNQLAVYDLETKTLLATGRLPSREILEVWMHFVTDDVVRVAYRLWNDQDYGMEIWELDVPERQWTQTGAVPAWQYEPSPAGDRLVVRWKLDQPLRVFDGRGEQELYQLGDRPMGYPAQARFLSAGRIAVAEAAGPSSTRLLVFSPQGVEVRRFEFESRYVVLGGEPAAGRLLVGLRDPVGGRDSAGHEKLLFDLDSSLDLYRITSAHETRLLDLDTGQELQRFPGLLPDSRPSIPGSPATRLLVGDHGALFRLDAAGGSVEPILGLGG